MEISRLLNTGLDAETLSICVRLCEQGINPEALSAVIRELRKASEALKVREGPGSLPCVGWGGAGCGGVYDRLPQDSWSPLDSLLQDKSHINIQETVGQNH